MITAAALSLALNLVALDVPKIDAACESAQIAIDIAHEHEAFVSAKEIFGSKAILIHTLYADESNIDLPPEHALLITWRGGWGSALYCKEGDWYGPPINPLQWRKIMEIAGGKSARK